MDLGDYWQENKRFVTQVALGGVGFLIGVLVIDGVFASDLAAAQGAAARHTRDLRKEMYGKDDLREAEAQNEALVAAVEALGAAATFVARDEFVVAPGESASNRYLRTFSDVRDDLLPRANRANLTVDAALGMPALSPTRDGDIVRYLEALDAIETIVSYAIDSRARRVEKIQVRLDPGLDTKVGVGRVERTRVKMRIVGESLALTSVLTSLGRPPGGRVLHVDEVEMVPARGKQDEVRMDLTVVIPRLSRVEEDEE